MAGSHLPKKQVRAGGVSPQTNRVCRLALLGGLWVKNIAWDVAAGSVFDAVGGDGCLLSDPGD
jgi:hypothetical protein